LTGRCAAEAFFSGDFSIGAGRGDYYENNLTAAIYDTTNLIY
jgi:hypothetical protein